MVPGRDRYSSAQDTPGAIAAACQSLGFALSVIFDINAIY